MRNFFSIIVIFAILLVGGGWVYTKQQREKAKVQVADELAEARKNFANKARSAANEVETSDYLRAIRAALTQYDEELKGRVYKKNKEYRNPEAYKQRVEAQFKEGKIDEAQRKSMLEGYELVANAYELLKNKSWNPVLSQRGGADTRLDIYHMSKSTTPDGVPVLIGKFFFWGIEDSTDARWGQLSIRLWHTAKEMVKEKGRMVEKDVEKVLGKQEGEAQPHIIVQRPANYIDEFPSFVSIGEVWFPVAPHQAEKMDLVFEYRTKTYGGGEVESSLKWEKLPIPPEWKLGKDQVWDADEIEATEDELAGRDGKTEEEEAKKQ